MAFEKKTLGRILKGAADMIRSAAESPKAGRSTTGTAKTRTPSRRKAAGGRKPAATPAPKPAPRPVPPAAARPAGRGVAAGTVPRLSSPYPGDFSGRASTGYAAKPDGDPDPGEVVWTWVPFEEDYSQGKDRPVLLIGRNGKRLLALMLTSKDRNNSDRRDGDYLDVGTGPWDSKGRPSEAKLDRILQLDPRDIRREGAVMDRAAFDRVAKALRQLHGWS
jgi:hypothetical protein